MSNNDKTFIVYIETGGHPRSSYLRKSAQSVDKISEDDPQITQIRADLSTGRQI